MKSVSLLLELCKRKLDLNLTLVSKSSLMVSSDRQGNVLGMVQDIIDCLVWAQESAAKFNFDKVRKLSDCTGTQSEYLSFRRLTLNALCSAHCLLQDKIVLIGHSAGAHLCALTTLFLTDEREELFIEAAMQRQVAQSVRGIIGEVTGQQSTLIASYMFIFVYILFSLVLGQD